MHTVFVINPTTEIYDSIQFFYILLVYCTWISPLVSPFYFSSSQGPRLLLLLPQTINKFPNFQILITIRHQEVDNDLHKVLWIPNTAH